MSDSPGFQNRPDHRFPGPPHIEARWLKPVVAPEGETTLLVRISAPEQADAMRRAPLDVAFVLDRSGSMLGGKLDLAKEGISLAITRLRDADRAALVMYDDAVDVVQPLAPTTPRLKASLRLALHGIDPGGSTYLSGGWVAGCQALAEAKDIPGHDGAASRIRRVILLTDGLANVGIVDPRELAEHAGALRRRGIATTTVGVGQNFDEGLLSAMAEAGGGNFQYVADPPGLREFFARELQELFSVAAMGFTVTLAMPPGLDAELISAFPVERRDGALDVAIGDLPAGDEIDLVFSMRIGHDAVGARWPLGVIASWTDPRADERQSVDVSLEALRRVGQHEADATPSDELVMEQAALHRAAAERRAGLDLDRAGRYAESRLRMARAREVLQAAPMTDAVRLDLEDSFMLADYSDGAAYQPHDRKTAQHREAQRRRGRLNPDAASTDDGG